MYFLEIVFKTISTKHTQQFKTFELYYLSSVEAIILVTTLQYKLAWQMLLY